MSLRINHNIASVNGHRNMLRNDMAISKSLEKLSSGLRINRAADDAAGLIISEQMRAQISGLGKAISNTETAIAMVQTAEGALDEMNTLLTKARELALHAANEGANDDSQLAADQSELDNIISSITRIANNTQFGTKKILDGSLDRTSLVTVAGGGTTGGNANLEANVTVPTTGVRRLDAGTYEAFLTTVYSAGTPAQGEVANGGFTGASLTGTTAATALTNATGLDAGDYQVALRSSSGNVFLQTFTATHSSTNDDASLSGSLTLDGTLTASGSIGGGTTIANTLTNVTNEVTNLNGVSLSINGGTVAGSSVAATHTLDNGVNYTLNITDGTTTYTATLAGTGANTVADLVSAFNADGTNSGAGVTASWTGAGAPAITFSASSPQAGAAGDGFYVTLSDSTSTASGVADPTTTGAGVGGAKSYTVELVDASNNVRGTYTENVAQGASTTMNQLLASFASSATLSGDVTAVSGVTMDSNGVIDFSLTVDGGVNANGYRIRISDSSSSLLSAASSGSAADDTLADMISAFNTGLSGASIDATTSIDGSGLDLAIGTGLATNDASNGYSLRLTNLATNAVVNSTATTGGTAGNEVAAQGELRDSLGNVVATLTGSGTGNSATILANADYGISIDLDDTFAATAPATTGVTLTYADDQNGAVFQIGANRDQTVQVALQSMRANDIGRNATTGSITDPLATLDSLRTGSYLTNGLAQEAISIIDKAIDDVTNQRGTLGAVQANSLESNLNSLRATMENTIAAESVIRDVDFAAESAMFTRNSIMIQASTAMLAQANQLPQNVLQLLG